MLPFARVLFHRVPEKLPASNRRRTFGAALEVQCVGFVLRSILPRVVAHLHCDAPGGTDAGQCDEEVSYQMFSNRKVRQALEFLQDSFGPRTVTLALIASEPLDRMSAIMQRLDRAPSGSPLREMGQSVGGIPTGAQQHLFHLLAPAPADSAAPSRSGWPRELFFNLFHSESNFEDRVE